MLPLLTSLLSDQTVLICFMNGVWGWQTYFLWQQPIEASRLIYIWIALPGAQLSLILIVPKSHSPSLLQVLKALLGV